MARKAAAAPADLATTRREVIDRVLARQERNKAATPATYAGPLSEAQVRAIVREEIALAGGPGEPEQAPAVTDYLRDWCDDREVSTFGSRVVLNDGEAAAYSILTSMRGGDPATVRRAVEAAGQNLDQQTLWLLGGVLGHWNSTAAHGCVTPLAQAAANEAERLGFNKQPRRRQRGPEPLSQVPGRMTA